MELLQKQFDDLQDVHTGAWCMTISIPETFGLYLDFVAIMFVACVCLSFILMDTGNIKEKKLEFYFCKFSLKMCLIFLTIENVLGGNVGLAISQSLIIVGTLQHGMRQSGEMIAHITSVERILQYINLPKEDPWTSDNPPPADWPKHGQLALKNVSMKYDRDETAVLKVMKQEQILCKNY